MGGGGETYSTPYDYNAGGQVCPHRPTSTLAHVDPVLRPATTDVPLTSKPSKISAPMQSLTQAMVCVGTLSQYATLVPLRDRESSTRALAFQMHVVGHLSSIN
jgi:hypothetical protein